MQNVDDLDEAASSEAQRTENTPYGLDLLKPGAASCGRGVAQALEVINVLRSNGIPCCVAGPRALVYYGAHRVPLNWEICVPDDDFARAKELLTSSPLNERYEPWHPVMPVPGSLVHTYPRFTLKGIDFFFFLVPAFEHLVDCSPGQCEHSPSGIPYPKLHLLAQSLLDTQRYADLEDLVDGMDLDEAWGEAYLRLDDPVPIAYICQKNDRILASLTDNMRGSISVVFCTLSETPDRRNMWLRIVRTKRRRIGQELLAERYVTRFRKVGSKDPREITDREV